MTTDSTLPPTATVESLSHTMALVRSAIGQCLATRQALAGMPAVEELWTVIRALNQVENILVGCGAVPPNGHRPLDPDLSDLALLDTPAARHLLAQLRAALVTAETVDEERGNVMAGYTPISPDGSRGTDYAESVSNLTCRLAREIEAPKGRD